MNPGSNARESLDSGGRERETRRQVNFCSREGGETRRGVNFYLLSQFQFYGWGWRKVYK
jgi:hypothetical protein